jgi:hypothetical protein
MKNLKSVFFTQMIKCVVLGLAVSLLFWSFFLSITALSSYGDTIGNGSSGTSNTNNIVDSGKYYYYQGNKIYLQREKINLRSLLLIRKTQSQHLHRYWTVNVMSSITLS